MHVSCTVELTYVKEMVNNVTVNVVQITTHECLCGCDPREKLNYHKCYTYSPSEI